MRSKAKGRPPGRASLALKLAALAGHPSLQELVVAQTAVGSGSLELLLALPALEHLFVWNAALDDGDLFRLGGARSLRGYDEEQFSGDAVGRAFVELRHLIDEQSYAYLFADLGVVEKETYPGFGIGVQFRTEVGILNVSYAMNDREGWTQGRIHAGISLGL